MCSGDVNGMKSDNKESRLECNEQQSIDCLDFKECSPNKRPEWSGK